MNLPTTKTTVTSAAEEQVSSKQPDRLNLTLLSRRAKGRQIVVETSMEPESAEQISPQNKSKRMIKRMLPIKAIACTIVLALSSVSIIQNLNGHLGSIKDAQSHMDIVSASTSSAPQADTTKHNEGEETSVSKKGGIAWLMTFPNSGTTYTSFLVAAVTGAHTATNYGAELNAQGARSEGQVLVRESASVLMNSPVPSWSDYNWHGGSMKKTWKPPTQGYILTKTHCGGYCFDCFAGLKQKATKDVTAFSKECGRGQYVTRNTTSGQFHAINGYTPTEKVARAVHIIRDPFDNVVARFHHEIKRMKEQAGSERWLAKYPNTRDGFRDFCNDLGAKWKDKEEKSGIYKDNMFALIKDVPCHSDFFRYIQWHNLAFATTADLGIPSKIILYEDYANNFNKTKDELLQFLQQDEVYDYPSFVAGKTYRHYYTEEEIDAVSIMFSKLGHQETRNKTHHYFKGYGEYK